MGAKISHTHKYHTALSKYNQRSTVIHAAPPITFKTKLRNQQVEEESSVTLSCELSKPGLEVEWRRGQELLKNNFKYQIKSRSGVMELTIKNTQLADSGLYSCSYRDVKTSANVNVTGEECL